ncbi:uncharacterized protein [Penaeus vannamei]|uniref:uncharacterized protein n=1 Tax=Penaeus vannamei TaxID=6689 RepID=UPI00387F5972
MPPSQSSEVDCQHEDSCCSVRFPSSGRRRSQGRAGTEAGAAVLSRSLQPYAAHAASSCHAALPGPVPDAPRTRAIASPDHAAGRLWALRSPSVFRQIQLSMNPTTRSLW